MDIATWLRESGLERHEQPLREKGIDAGRLTQRTADDLAALDVACPHRRRLLAGLSVGQAGPGR